MKIEKHTLEFLRDLKNNNNRDWFQANKSRYEDAKENFQDFIATLIMQIAKFDPAILNIDPKKSIFRIYRDTRFSKDKSPYKTNFGAHLVPGAAKPHDRAGYYMHLESGASILAGGAYMPAGPWIKGIRARIAEHGDDLRKIIRAAPFKKYFGEISGEQLKSAPRDFPKDHPEIELLKFKSFLAVHELSDEVILDKNFSKSAAQVYRALKPFDDFLNACF